jgi:hypothetical protein
MEFREKKGHERNREVLGMCKGKGRWGSGIKRTIRGVNVIKVHYMHIQKCHKGTHYFVQYILIKILKRKIKKRTTYVVGIELGYI